jgi:hypothetical protein
MKMIDRKSRNITAAVLRRLMSGKITNDEFENTLAGACNADPAISAIGQMGWLLYSDLHEHYLVGKDRVGPFDRREVIRWILFLDSDFEYVWPKLNLPGVDPLRRVRRLPWLHPFSDGVSKRDAAKFLEAGDYFAWPFASRAQFKYALRNPRRLAGRQAAAA